MAVKTMTSRLVSGVKDRVWIQHTAVLAVILEHFIDLVANFAIRDLDIILGAAAVVHKRQETIVSDVELHSISISSFLTTDFCLPTGIQYA